MTAPRIEIDLDKIRRNAQVLAQCLGKRGISVTGVTKAFCGRPGIAKAMLDGGVAGLADAHIENVERMRQAGVHAPITLIRTPMLSQADRIPQICEASYNTELDVIHRLAEAALRANTVHGVILMVEMGDRREGIMPGHLPAVACKVTAIPGVYLKGIGANFACLSGAAPDPQAMAQLSDLASDIEGLLGLRLEIISGGNSANLPSLLGGGHSGRINDLRLGEAVLLGVDPVSGRRIDGLVTDAFTVVAEVIETRLNPKDSQISTIGPVRARSRIAAGRDQVRRSIVAIGRQDTDIDGLSMPAGLTLIGATSDHLIVGTSETRLAIGAEIAFQPNYSALMRIMAAPNVEQVVLASKGKVIPAGRNARVPA